MSKTNVYISYSIPNEPKAYEVAEFLKIKGVNPVYWKMGTSYSNEPLCKADAVVFILGSYYWSKDLSDLSAGVHKELDTALILNIPIYIAYKRKDGSLQVYKAVVGNNQISGVANTCFESPRSQRYCPSNCENSKSTYKSTYKRRHK